MYLFGNKMHISALILMWILVHLQEFLVPVFSRQGQQSMKAQFKEFLQAESSLTAPVGTK